jgi:hypothetical protein
MKTAVDCLKTLAQYSRESPKLNIPLEFGREKLK